MRKKVLIFVQNEKKMSKFHEKWVKRSPCREKWPQNVPFSWKMTQKCAFFMKNEKKSTHFREKWEINSQFREKWAKKLVSHVPHFSVELSLTICIGWELKIATFVVKVQYTTIHFKKYMKKLCYSPAIRAKDLLLVQTMSSIGVS